MELDEDAGARRRAPSPAHNPSLETFQRRLFEAEAAAEANDGLARRHPDLSAKTGLTDGQRAGGWALIGSALVWLVHDADSLVITLMTLASWAFSFVIAMRLASAITALIAGSSPAPPRLPDEDLVTLSVLAPLYHEANMVAGLIDALEAFDYPPTKMDVWVLVEIDDTDTMNALLASRLPPWVNVLPVPAHGPKTKPKALNYGLQYCKGELVVVFDAEDRPDPAQARTAVAAFRSGPKNLAVVQAPLLIHNAETNWLSRQFALEYAIHFRVWLPFLTRMRAPLALGGTSNYFDRKRLVEAGGWDAYNVTEDADLGFRLARFGGEAAMVEPPTWEEAPIRLKDWFNQRTRWIKGHLQTWLVLMRDPIRAVAEMGAGGFLMAQVNIGGSLLASLMHAPILAWIALQPFTGLPAISGWHAALLGVGYGAAVMAAIGSRHTHLRPVDFASFLVYWPMASVAMVRALWELKSRPHAWAKTPHGVAPRSSRRSGQTTPLA